MPYRGVCVAPMAFRIKRPLIPMGARGNTPVDHKGLIIGLTVTSPGHVFLNPVRGDLNTSAHVVHLQ